MNRKSTETELRGRLMQNCPVLNEIMNTGMTLTVTGEKIPTCGFSTVRNLVTLRALMESGRFTRTLEIGLAHAGSALSLAGMHREQGREAEAQHIAIDPFQHDFLKSAGLTALERAGLRSYVKHINQRSQIALPDMLKEGLKFGLIYIDGSHCFDDVFVDFYYCDRLLESPGFLVFDDCADYRVRKVTRFIRRNYAMAYAEVPLEELFVQEHPLRLRIARLLGRNQVRVFQRISERYREWDSPLRTF